MSTLSPHLKAFLLELQAQPLWRQLVEQAVPPEPLQRYNPSRPEPADQSHDKWVYLSGREVEREAWLTALLPQEKP